MSKSKNNGVDPQTLIDEYGADTARFFILNTAPPEQSLNWSDEGVVGASRFIKKLWAFAHEHLADATREDSIAEPLPAAWAQVRFEVHSQLKQANYDFGKLQFNTVATAGIKILNALSDAPRDGGRARSYVLREGMSLLLRLLAPITPHISHSLWRELGYGDDILAAGWPAPDPQALLQDEIELVLQVNGKLRGNMRVARDADRAVIEKLAMQNANVQKHVNGQAVKKVVVVPGRLVNVVV
jgi:leucyl-tRNA synthetase